MPSVRNTRSCIESQWWQVTTNSHAAIKREPGVYEKAQAQAEQPIKKATAKPNTGRKSVVAEQYSVHTGKQRPTLDSMDLVGPKMRAPAVDMQLTCSAFAPCEK